MNANVLELQAERAGRLDRMEVPMSSANVHHSDEAGSGVTVLIVAFCSRDTIGRCLDALSLQTRPPDRVLLLENGSPVGERIERRDLPDWVDFVDGAENLGFAGGNNRLARMAGGSWLAFLNPDAFPDPTWLECLLAAARRYPGVSMFGSTQLAASEAGLLDGVGDVYHASGFAYRAGYGRPVSIRPPDGQVFGACAAAALVRRDVFEALSGFDEDFFCYNEDVDLAFRARLLGHTTVQVHDAEVAHLGYASSGRRSTFATYYGARNRIWVFVKNMPGALFWMLILPHIAITLALWIRFALIGQGRVFGKAIWDALRELPRMWRKRREVQGSRTVSVFDVARALSWNPVLLATREQDVRPMPETTFKP